MQRFKQRTFELIGVDERGPETSGAHDLDVHRLKRVEREIRAEDGRRLLARIAPYRFGEDRIEGTVLAFFDVTQLRNAEERTLATERRMAHIAESVEDYAILTLYESGTISMWNVGAEKIFDFSALEAIGRPFELIFTDEDREAGIPAEELQKGLAVGSH